MFHPGGYKEISSRAIGSTIGRIVPMLILTIGSTYVVNIINVSFYIFGKFEYILNFLYALKIYISGSYPI